MNMSTTPIPGTEKRKRGRRPRYGSPAVARVIYMPAALKSWLEHEARVRNIRDECNDHSMSSVAVDLLYGSSPLVKPTGDDGR